MRPHEWSYAGEARGLDLNGCYSSGHDLVQFRCCRCGLEASVARKARLPEGQRRRLPSESELEYSSWPGLRTRIGTDCDVLLAEEVMGS